MKPESIKIFQCPNCHQELVLIDSKLQCSHCKSMYPLINNIPRFVSQSNYADSFGYQWNIHRRTQMDSYTGLPISRNRLFEVTQWPEKMLGQKILEAGSGAGRFTEVLLGTEAEIFSFDYSSAVDANWANNKQFPNLNLFQADIYNIPLKKYSFDKVVCLGVLQHTPDPEKAFKSLAQYVSPGGELVIDVYEKRLISLIQWKYFLRPLTKHMSKQLLYKVIESVVPLLLPLSIFLRNVAGRIGARIMPIVEYSNLGLPYELNKQWAILDTFDMYAPAYDYPQSIFTVKRWFREVGFVNVSVRSGPNGVVGKGSRPN
ncbi:hypothetical protein JZK55_12150 [Dissulfurispira thermophila]|uniref:Methyltransferase type 11 domain-containing protein n=2 Tax=root TaxID=1 RepID=A0A7G1H2B8_9BACT|nr:methyltransferase domain-containing protein [Dissulfurispira thermophila]BCB96293.1 hypothetical protein JZK55_12150 [Dissulfurispira thermophila]